MKTIVTTPTVDITLRTLGPDERQRVHTWFDHLKNWDGDPFVRENSPLLPGMHGVRMLRTSTDLRIFFTMEDETITLLDLATRQSILRTFAH